MSRDCKSSRIDRLTARSDLEPSAPFDWDNGRPVAKASVAAGLVVHVADGKVGLTAGATRTDLFSLGRDSSARAFIAYRSAAVGPGRFWICEGKP